MFGKIGAAVLAAMLSGALIGGAQAMDAKLQLVTSGVSHPLAMVSPPDGTGRKFIVEQKGDIRILNAKGELQASAFLNIQHKMVTLRAEFDEPGLYDIAFHPNFAKNGLFYISYAGLMPGDADLGLQLWYNHANVVAEYRVSKDDPNKADPFYERIVMRTYHPMFNHNGHWIAFGPDGDLYVSVGDGGLADDYGTGHNKVTGNAQDLSDRHGKILRVNVDGVQPFAVPADNPFVKDSSTLPEIYAYGFRNPWRCSFDLGGTHELICADVGQNSVEEVDNVKAGGNYGWRRKEGSQCFDYIHPDVHPATCDSTGLIDPIIEYANCNVSQDCKGLSITGGYVYRGSNKQWDGTYFFGDWSRSFVAADGHLFAGTRNGDKWSMEDVKITNMDFKSYVLSFAQDADGEVYVLTSNNTGPASGPAGGVDSIYKIVP